MSESKHPADNNLEDNEETVEPDEFQSLKGNHYKKPLGEQPPAVHRQALMVILANIGLLSTGMALGMPAVVLNQLTNTKETVYLTSSQSSWFASINTLSSPLGGLLSAYLLDKFGRKNTLYVVNIFALTAWTLLATVSQTDMKAFYIQLLVSRFVTGLGMGVSTAPAGVYAAEISMPKIRGRLILGTSLSAAAGITLQYVIGYIIRDDFHLIALICCGYQIISLLCVIPLPETPSWLLSKHRVNEAKKSLNYFRGLDRKADITHPEVLAEFNVLQKCIQLHEGEKKPSFLRSLRLPEVYKPLLILIGLFAFQQLTGIFVVIVYAVQISEEAGVSIDPFMCAVLIGVARLVTTCPMGYLLEKWGRRRSGLISATGMSICMFLLASCSWFEWLKNIPYLPVVGIISFIVISTIGLYTLPFFMISELYPQKVRGPASGLTVAIGMIISFLCIKMYPELKSNLGNEYCFVLYGVMAFLAIIFVYLCLPETRGRTLIEIEEQFRSKKTMRKTPTAAEIKEIYVL